MSEPPTQLRDELLKVTYLLAGRVAFAYSILTSGATAYVFYTCSEQARVQFPSYIQFILSWVLGGLVIAIFLCSIYSTLAWIFVVPTHYELVMEPVIIEINKIEEMLEKEKE